MPPSKHSRRRSSGTVMMGRIHLLLLFVFLEGLDVALYLNSPPRLLPEMTGAAIVNTIWTAVCVIGILCRQNVARYFLFVRLILSVFLNGLLELGYGQDLGPLSSKTRVLIAVGITAGHLASAIFLIWSPAIRRLARPDYYFDTP